MASSEWNRYSFFLPDDYKTGLDRLEKRDGIVPSEAIRRAIFEYLTKRRIPVKVSAKSRKHLK